jgi:hypothetical protein
VHIPFIVAGHLQIVVDLDPDLAYHFDADPDFYLIVIRIGMHIHAPLAQIRKRSKRSEHDNDGGLKNSKKWLTYFFS